MFTVIINGEVMNVGDKLPDKIVGFVINYNPPPRVNVRVRKNDMTKIGNWLNDIIDRLNTDWVMYNGTYIKTEELNKVNVNEFC